MTIFQQAYNTIKSWKAPGWLKTLLQGLNDLMIALLKELSQQYINYLKTEIIYAAGQNWTSKEKFEYVFRKAREGFSEFSVTLKDREINLLIEYLVNLLKKQGAIV